MNESEKEKKLKSLISEDNKNTSEDDKEENIIKIERKHKNKKVDNVVIKDEDMNYPNPPKKKINIIDINSEKISQKISERNSQKNDNNYLYMHDQPKNKESNSIHNSKNNQEKKNNNRDIINNLDLLKLRNNKNKIEDIKEEKEKKSNNLNITNNYNDNNNRDEKGEIFPLNEYKEYEEDNNSLRILIKTINDKKKNKKN